MTTDRFLHYAQDDAQRTLEAWRAWEKILASITEVPAPMIAQGAGPAAPRRRRRR